MPHAHIGPRRSHRRLVGALCIGLMVAIGVSTYVAYRHYTDPERICRMAEDFLEQLTQRKVSIASASFSLGEGIQLREVYLSNQPLGEVSQSSPPVREEEVLSCREISIVPDSWALLGGTLKIERFAAIQPTLTLVHDANVGWDNVAAWVRGIVSHRNTTEGAAPPIELRHVRVRMLHRSPAGEREIEDFQLTIRGRTDPANPKMFDMVWQDANDPDANGHMQIDLMTGRARNVRGGLPTMSIRGVLLAMEAGVEGADELPELLGIEGRVRVRDYDFMQSADASGSSWASAEFLQAKISIPISDEERKLKAVDRYLRFENISGTVRMTGSNIEAQLHALLHGSPCTISAKIDGPLHAGSSLADVSLAGDVSLQSLDLPDPRGSAAEERLIHRWPAVVRFYEEFSPHGRVSTEFRLEKAAGENEKVVARKVVVTAQGADASCDIFPYRVRDLHGTVEYDGPQGLRVRELCGMQDQARVCLDGWVEAPKRSSPANFVISGKDVPIDSALLTALHPNQQRLVEYFGFKGNFHAQVALQRDRSETDSAASPWNTVIQVSFDDLQAAFQPVPTPIRHLAGSATIYQDRIEIEGIEGELGSGSLELHGLAHFQEGGVRNLDLDLAASDVDLDASLLADLPRGVTARIEDFGLTGCVSARSEVTFNQEAGWHHETRAGIRSMGVQPKLFPIPMEHGLADLRIDTERVEIIRARGSYRDADLFAKGSFALGEKRQADVHIEAERLPIDNQFRAAAPAALREAIADWFVDEPVETKIRFRQGDGVPTWSGDVSLKDATLRHRAFAEPLRNVDALVSFADNQVQCNGATGRFGRAALEADFHALHESQSANATVRLNIHNMALDEIARGLLPVKAQEVWNDLTPMGRINLTLDDLTYSRDGGNSPTWSVRGQLDPLEVQCWRGDLAIEKAAIPFEGMLVDRLGGLTLSGNLRDGDLAIYGQRLTNASASWYAARVVSGDGRAGVRDFHGELDGGTATTEAQLSFDSGKAQYRAASSIQGADLAAWLESWRASRAPADNQSAASKNPKPTDVRGLMDAQFHLAGTINNPASRTGGGRVEVRDGYIYKLPIFMAILNVLNINLPSNDVLSEARGQFYVMGTSVRLADIVVSGESLSLVGQGTMSLSDQSVDLTLINAGAGRLSGIPVLAELWEGASRELVELRVTGPVSQPQVRASSFRGVTDEFKKLFQKRKPKH